MHRATLGFALILTALPGCGGCGDKSGPASSSSTATATATATLAPPIATVAASVRVKRATERNLGPLHNDQRMKDLLAKTIRTQAPSQIATATRAANAKLVKHGWTRLSDDQIAQLFELRKKLAQFSTPVCAAVWSGAPDARQFIDAFASLDDQSLDHYFELQARATAADLDAQDKPLPEMDKKVFSAALDEVGKVLSDADKEKLGRLMQDGPKTEEDRCFLQASFDEGLGKLEGKARTDAYRALLLSRADND